jgi:hypothetical protein
METHAKNTQEQYNKTVIASIGLICLTIVISLLIYTIKVAIHSNESVIQSTNNVRIAEANTSIVKSTDKFTHCLQIVMSETRQSGKPIDGEKAKNVCK